MLYPSEVRARRSEAKLAREENYLACPFCEPGPITSPYGSSTMLPREPWFVDVPVGAPMDDVLGAVDTPRVAGGLAPGIGRTRGRD